MKNIRKIVLFEIENKLYSCLKLFETYKLLYKEYESNLEVEFRLKKESRKGKYSAQYIVSLSIFPVALNKKEAMVSNQFKYYETCIARISEDNNGYIIVKENKNYLLWYYLEHGIKFLQKHGLDRYSQDHTADFIFRLFFPKKSGRVKNIYRGKSIFWLRVLFDFLPIIFTMVINIYLIFKNPDSNYFYWLPH